MGIPGFWTRIEPYGRNGRLADNSEGRRAIIDGPSLVHHVHNELRKAGRASGVTSRPSYGQLGTAVVGWLEKLDGIGFQVEKIIFDGALPSTKIVERVSRLNDTVGSLVRCRNMHKTFNVASANDMNIKPCMIYAAALEWLFSSRFADMTEVVPGEADDFCALEASKIRNATIFTADSDLILFESGVSTEIVMLQTLDRPLKAEPTVVSATIFTPKAIPPRFKLQNLVGPAYLMEQTPSLSLSAAVSGWKVRASEIQRRPNYKVVLARYTLSGLQDESAVDRFRSLTAGLRLDTRVSELVCSVVGLSGQPASTEHNMFLPALIDDPTVKSAWRIASDVRQLAYSILTPISPLRYVSEYCRKGSTVDRGRIALIRGKELTESLHEWANVLSEHLQDLQQFENIDRWRLLTFGYIMQNVTSNGKRLPGTKDRLDRIQGCEANDWQAVHFDAQFQATLYSFRMLANAADIVASNCPGSEDSEMQTELWNLHEILKSFPRTVLAFEGAQDVTRRADWRPIVMRY